MTVRNDAFTRWSVELWSWLTLLVLFYECLCFYFFIFSGHVWTNAGRRHPDSPSGGGRTAHVASEAPPPPRHVPQGWGRLSWVGINTSSSQVPQARGTNGHRSSVATLNSGNSPFLQRSNSSHSCASGSIKQRNRRSFKSGIPLLARSASSITSTYNSISNNNNNNNSNNSDINSNSASVTMSGSGGTPTYSTLRRGFKATTSRLMNATTSVRRPGLTHSASLGEYFFYWGIRFFMIFGNYTIFWNTHITL